MEQQNQPTPQLEKSKKKCYQKWWFWLIVTMLVAILTLFVFDCYNGLKGSDLLLYKIHHHGVWRCKCVPICTGSRLAIGQGLNAPDIQYTFEEYAPYVIYIVKDVYFGIPIRTIINNCPDGTVQGSKVEGSNYNLDRY